MGLIHLFRQWLAKRRKFREGGIVVTAGTQSAMPPKVGSLIAESVWRKPDGAHLVEIRTFGGGGGKNCHRVVDERSQWEREIDYEVIRLNDWLKRQDDKIIMRDFDRE